MKKTMMRILVTCLIILSAFGLIACGNDTAVKKITGIEIVSTPKTEYSYGEELDLTAFSMKVTYEKTEVTYAYADVESYITVSGYDKNKAGEQTVVVTYKIAEEEDVYEGKVDFKVTVGKAKGDIMFETSLDKTYDGTPIEITTKDYTVISDGAVTVKWMSGDEEVKAPTNAGEYRLVVSVPATATYTEATAEKVVTIAKQAIEKPAYTESNFVFDNTDKTANITASELYTITDNVKKNAGTYTATVALNDKANYIWDNKTDTDITFDWTISSATGTLAFNSGFTPSKTYDGSAVNNIEASNYTKNGDGNVTVEWFNKGSQTPLTDKPVNAGEYTVKVSVAGTTNYTAVSKTLDFTISKASYTMSGVTFENASKVYNGAEQGLVVDGTLPTGADNIQVTVSYSEGRTIAGSIEITATFATTSANYNVPSSMTATLTITPKALAIPTLTDDDLVYNGSQQTVKLVVDSEIINLFGVTKSYNAGEYTAKVSLRDNANYIWADNTSTEKDIVWHIAKRVVQKPTCAVTSLTYNKLQQSIAVTVDTENAQFFIKKAGSVSETNAGDYSVTYSIHHNTQATNVVWSDDSTADVTISWSIEQVEVTIPTLTVDDLVYNGSQQTAKIPQSELYTITGNEETNAGTYTATITIKDKVNYVWADDTSIEKEITWNIAKANATIAVSGEYKTYLNTLVYNGAPITAPTISSFITDSDGVITWSWEEYTSAGGGSFVDMQANALPTDANGYYLYYSVAEGDNYNAISENSYNFTIAPKQLTVSNPTIAPLTYCGSTNVLPTFVTVGTLDGVVNSDDVACEALTATLDNKNAGENRTVTVAYTLTGDAKHNYVAPVNSTVENVSVAKKMLHIHDTTLQGGLTRVYDGITDYFNYPNVGTLVIYTAELNASHGECEGDDAMNKVVGATLDSADVGERTLTIDYSFPEDNYYIDPDDYFLTVTIVRKKIDKAAYTPSAFTYDGTEKTADITESNCYEIAGNKQTNAGNYVATVTLKGNYCWNTEDSSTEVLSFNWSIAQKEIYNPGAIAPTNYTGIEQTATISDTADYTVSNNRQTNAGTYLLKVSLRDKTNCRWKISGNSDDIDYEWVINRAALTWANTESKHVGLYSKIYDGNNVVDPSQFVIDESDFVLNGIINSEAITIDTNNITAVYNSATVGNDKIVTITYNISGETKNNYDTSSLTETFENAVINLKQLDVTGGMGAEHTEIVWSSDLTATLDKAWFDFDFVDGCVAENEAVTLDWTATLDSLVPNNEVGITVTFTISGDTASNYITPINYTTKIKLSKATPVITLGDFVLCEDMVATVKSAGWKPYNSTYDAEHGTESVVFYAKGGAIEDTWNVMDFEYHTFDTGYFYKFVYTVSGGTYYDSNSCEVEFDYVTTEATTITETITGSLRESPVVSFVYTPDASTIVFKLNYTGVDAMGNYAFKFRTVPGANMSIFEDFGKEINPDADEYYRISVEGESKTLYVVIDCTDSGVSETGFTLFEYFNPENPVAPEV